MRGIVFDIDDTLYCRQDMLIRAAEIVLGVKIPDWQEFMRVYYEKSDVNMQMLESGEVSTHAITRPSAFWDSPTIPKTAARPRILTLNSRHICR